MRQAGHLVGCLGALAVIGGCSGAGAPRVPPSAAALQAAADSHLSAVSLTRSWFAILYARPPANPQCDARWDPAPSRPSDPLGSMRFHGVMSDCSTMDTLLLRDGSGRRTCWAPDGRLRSRLVWDVARDDDGWTKQDLDLAIVGVAELEYESGFDRQSALADQYARGETALTDGRRMDFDFRRNYERDRLVLALYDGSRLQVTVPLATIGGQAFCPRFDEDTAGTYLGAGGAKQRFTMGSSTGDWWDVWHLRGPGDVTGEFTIAEDFSGAGTIVRADGPPAGLRWTSAGDGTLQPVGAAATDVMPSEAARAFQVDQWVKNAAALGPMPLY